MAVNAGHETWSVAMMWFYNRVMRIPCKQRVNFKENVNEKDTYLKPESDSYNSCGI